MKKHKPNYYDGNRGRDIISLVKEFNINFNLGNVLKYITRAGKKTSNKLEDLYKAQEYLAREIDYLQNQEAPAPQNVIVKESPKVITKEPKVVIPEKLKLDEYDLVRLVEAALQINQASPRTSQGLAIMLVLEHSYKELYSIILNTKLDPSKGSKVIPKMLEAILKK